MHSSLNCLNNKNMHKQGSYLGKAIVKVEKDQQNFDSSHTIQDEENNLQLMIRAHHKIRTLEQDNQILRMHVQLLTKDNKELTKILEKTNKQKNSINKSNEQLKNKMKELQIKLQAQKVKQQIYSMERHRKVQMKTDKQLMAKQKQVIDKLTEDQKQSKEKQYIRTQEKVQTDNNKTSSYFTRIDNLQDLRKNNSCYIFRNSEQNKNTLKSTQKQPKNLCSFGHRSLSKFYQDDRPTKIGQQAEQLNASQKIKIQGKAQQNCYEKASPLIRRNSPNKDRNKCQFHQGIRNGSSSVSFGHSHSSSFMSGTGHEFSGHAITISKKFNYTNWRKNNNNLMVWKTPSHHNAHGKAIMLNR